MKQCTHCGSDMPLYDSQSQQRLKRNTYHCAGCRAQQVKGCLEIPGNTTDLDPYYHFERMRAYRQKNTTRKPDCTADRLTSNV